MILDCNWHIVSDAEMRSQIAGKKICVFGASKRNTKIYELLPNAEINFVLDNDSGKWGKLVDGLQIVKPQYFDDTVIVSAVADCRPLAPQVGELGYGAWYFLVADDVFEQKYRKIVEFMEKADSDFVWSHSSYKYIHVIPDQKFIYPVATILEQSFDIREHAFLVYGFDESNPHDMYQMWPLYQRLACTYGNIALTGSLYSYDRGMHERLRRIEDNLANCEKIIFHGEWMNDWVFGFFKSKIPYVQSKGILIPWSGNFGNDVQNERTVNELLRFCRLVCFGSSSERVKNILQKVKFSPATIIYRSGPDYSLPVQRPQKTINPVPKVLISHSCFPQYNAVLEGLDLLRNLKGSIEIYCLASYGDPAYIEKVRAYGSELYGNSFHLIEEYMPYEEYVSFISSMDVAAFAMNLPAGVTTIKLLAYTGVKLFLLKEPCIENVFSHQGIRFDNVKNIPRMTLTDFLHNNYAEDNFEAVKDRLDVEANAKRWRNMLEYDFQ